MLVAPALGLALVTGDLYGALCIFSLFRSAPNLIVLKGKDAILERSN